MAYGIVLAEYTAKVTVAYKDGAGAMATNQRTLFTEMCCIAGKKDISACSAESGFTGHPVNPTFPGTEDTLPKKIQSLFDPVGQLTGFVAAQIPSLLCSLIIPIQLINYSKLLVFLWHREKHILCSSHFVCNFKTL